MVVRLSLFLALFLSLLLIAACGDSSGGDDVAPDAAAAPVVEISCTGVTPTVTITTSTGEYSPAEPTIAVGDVVKFELSAGHTAHSLDELFAVAQGEWGCFRFLSAGDYGFYCQVHGFTGTIHVQ